MMVSRGAQPATPSGGVSLRARSPLRPAAPRKASYGGEYAAVLLLALAFYVVSVAPGPLWQDSGMAQVRVLQRDLHGELGLALSHPLYYVLAIAFQWLPFSESAFKTNLVSAVFGAVTVASVFLLLRLVTGRRTPAVVGALSLAVAHTFWQHCALAEVYTVSTALLVAELLCLWQYAHHEDGRWLILLFLLNGLGVSNHMVAVLSLACYGALLVFLLVRRRVTIGVAAGAAFAWLAGAGLYLGLIVAEIASGAGVGAALRSALFGTHYAANVLNLGVGGRLLLNSVLYLGLNFPTPVALLALPGLFGLPGARARLFGRVLLALLAIHLLWALRYDVPDQYTFFIPAIVLIALLIGLGAARFLRRRSARWRTLLIAGGLLPALVYVPLPQVARRAGLSLGVGRAVPYRDTYRYFLWPWKTRYRGAGRFAIELRDQLPRGAYVVADTTTVRPIHYLRLTGRWRADIRVWPPLGQTATAGPASESELRPALAAGLVYVVSPVPGYCPAWLLEEYDFVRAGVAYRVEPRGVPATSRPTR